MVYALQFMVYSLRFKVYALQFTDFGLLLTAYGLPFMFIENGQVHFSFHTYSYI